MEQKRILITGGAGFIGSNLANHLAGDNTVVALDNEYLGDPANLSEDVRYVKGDVLDDDLPVEGVDAVVHLAALSSLTMHEEDVSGLREGARVNVEGFANVVEQARQAGCDTVAYASTSSVYAGLEMPWGEELGVEAKTGYEASKLARERYAEYFSNAHGMNMAGLRFFSVYQGYGGSEEHKGEYANIISQFASDLANGDRPVVYGDGEHTRDFTHVSDIVRGIEMALDNRLDGRYNLGTGECYTANEVIAYLNEELGTDIEPEYVENPIPEEMFVDGTQADATKISTETGWVPKIDFEDGVKLVCEPYTEREDVKTQLRE